MLTDGSIGRPGFPVNNFSSRASVRRFITGGGCLRLPQDTTARGMLDSSAKLILSELSVLLPQKLLWGGAHSRGSDRLAVSFRNVSACEVVLGCRVSPSSSQMASPEVRRQEDTADVVLLPWLRGRALSGRLRADARATLLVFHTAHSLFTLRPLT